MAADIACFPWVAGLSSFYKADDTLELASFPTVKEWVGRCMERPASKVGGGPGWLVCWAYRQALLRCLLPSGLDGIGEVHRV